MSGAGRAPVRAVVFDMGGVLTVDPFAGMEAYAARIGIPREVVADAIRSGAEFREVETGRRTFRDFLIWLCVDIEERFGVRVEIRELAAALVSGQEVRPEMPDLLAELRGSGLRLAILTNNAQEARSWWESGVLPLELFDAVFDSSALGVRKPDPEVFEIVLARLELAPDEVVFVDDLEENVAGARRTGMRGLVFADPQQCRSGLRAMLGPGYLDGGVLSNDGRTQRESS